MTHSAQIDCTALKMLPRDMRQIPTNYSMDIDTAEQERRIAYAIGLGLPNLSLLRDIAPPGTRVMVCGGGPSIKNTLPTITKAKANGFVIVALNVTHDWLLESGVKPDFGIMLDPAPRVAGYQTPTRGVNYIIGSTVHPSVWQRFREAGHKPFWFVPIANDTQHNVIMARFPNSNPLFISGATTVGLRAINILRFMGWQTIDLAGYDSCRAPGGALYAYAKPHVYHDDREAFIVSQRTGDKFTFVSNGAMSRQIMGFQSVLDSMNVTETNGRIGGIRLIVHGDGAIPWMAWKDGGSDAAFEHADPAYMQAKYGKSRHWNYDKDEEYEFIAA